MRLYNVLLAGDHGPRAVIAAESDAVAWALALTWWGNWGILNVSRLTKE